MDKKNFSFLLAKRNIFANKKTTTVIIITLSLIFAVFMMMLGVKSIYRSIFTKEAESNYSGIDIVISYDEYSPARFINKRKLIEEYQNIDFALAFFNLQVLTEKEQETYYSYMFSSLPHEFEILMDIDVEISADETIITESYSENYDLSVGDYFSFYILETAHEFKVIDIVKDKGVFSGNAFFVNKEEIIAEVYDLNYLNNFGNNIYLRTNDSKELYTQLKLDDDYQSYSVKLVVDEERIEAIVNENTSMIVVVGIIVLLALLIVLNSLFIIVLKDIYLEIGVFETLGDEKSLGYKVCYIQWALYVLISFSFGFIISHIIVNIGAYFYGTNEIVFINPLIIILSFMIIATLIFFKNLVIIRKHYKMNTVKKIRNNLYVLAKYNYFLMLLSGIVIIFMFITKPFSIKYFSLIIIILSIYLSMNFIILLIKIFPKIFHKSKNIFSLFNSKHMQNNKNIHQSLSVIFLSLIVIAIMLTVGMFISDEIENVRNDNNLDILMVNIYNYEDSLVDELKAYDTNAVNPGLVYKNVLVDLGDSDDILVRTLVSLDYDDFSKYFNYQLDEVDSIYDEHTLAYVLLPMSYKMVYGLNKGDIISIDLNPELKNKPFVVGGFINTNFDHFAYTNLYAKLDYYQAEYNSVLINSENKNILMTDLIKEYSSKMYYFIDAEEQIESQLAVAENVLALFTVITIFVIMSFMFVVFNNTVLRFYALKNDYAKIKVIGTSNNDILKNLVKEFLIIIFIILVVGLAEIILLSRYLRYVLLFFDYYKELVANELSISISYIIIIIVLSMSYLYYYLKVVKITISDEIRIQ